MNSKYHGEPATVWSLTVLFVILCGDFPMKQDLDKIKDNIWINDGLSLGEIFISAKGNFNPESYYV